MTMDLSDESLPSEYVRFPFFRETCRRCVEILADVDRQRRVLVEKSDRDPWAVDEVTDAIEDLDMVQDYRAALDELMAEVTWNLDMAAVSKPDGCEHGGASFGAIGADELRHRQMPEA